MRNHKSLTFKRVLRAAKASAFGTEHAGFCRACGSRQGGCEPDARGDPCEACGENEVFGAEELLLMS